MIQQLQERKETLQGKKKRLNSKASLRNVEGKQYIRCMVLLAMTEMQIDELLGNEKTAL